jgi:hypothetical protein
MRRRCTSGRSCWPLSPRRRPRARRQPRCKWGVWKRVSGFSTTLYRFITHYNY